MGRASRRVAWSAFGLTAVCVRRCSVAFGAVPARSASEASIQRDEPAAEQTRERHVLGVIGLPPSELVGNMPGLRAQILVLSSPDRALLKACARRFGVLPSYTPPPGGKMQSRPRLRPHQRRREEAVFAELVKAVDGRARVERDARVDDQHQRPRRDSWINLTTSGTGRPESKRFHRSGMGSVRGSSAAASRSSSSITCWVPTLASA